MALPHRCFATLSQSDVTFADKLCFFFITSVRKHLFQLLLPARANIVQKKKQPESCFFFCWSRRRDLNPRLLVPRRNTPLLSAFAYVKGIDFTVGCSSPRKNAARFIRGPRIMVRDARGHGQTLATTKQKGQGENLVLSVGRGDGT